ncbi:MAG: enoyl-CoA hydratase/isomerase family protein [Phycisphaeraceae bacterium]|nr:enoyl-CoA hydratase/isomerase family protein [Phycisphaeraceae bacterium]
MADVPLRFEQDASGAFAGVGVLWLDQPGRPVVVLDHPLMLQIDRTVRALPRDLRGLVLASANARVFVAGADLKAIAGFDDASLHRYLEFGSNVFGLFAALPFPTVAAINGAALGGGLEIAMHCDGLVAAPSASGKPYPVGLPEAGLSICPGWGGTNLLPARMDAAEAIRRTVRGTPMTFDEACSAGMFDEVAPTAEALLPTAKQWIVKAGTGSARRDGAPSRWIGRAAVASRTLWALDEVRRELGGSEPAESVLGAIEVGLTRGWKAALQAERDSLVRLRNAPAGKAAIEAFLSKSAAR